MLAAATGAVASITSAVEELNPAAQALALRVLQGVAAAGAAVTPNVADSATSGLSNVADSVLLGVPGGAGSGAAAGGGGAQPGALLGEISAVVDTIAVSLYDGMLVPGESAVSVSSHSIQFRAQLDSTGATSRLYAAPLTLPDGVAQFSLPAGIFGSGREGTAESGVRTLLAGFAFNIHRPDDPLGVSTDPSGATTAKSITRLRFAENRPGAAEGDDDASAEISVAGLTTPVLFDLPAAPRSAEGAGAVCRFWDPLVPGGGSFSSAGCAALPSPLPQGHLARWDLQSLEPPLPPPNATMIGGGNARQPQAAPPQRGPPVDPSRCTAEDGSALYPSLRGAEAKAMLRGDVGPFWALTGPLMCGCKSLLLDCKADSEAAAAASARVLRQGGSRAEAATAAAAARTTVWPSARRALQVPAVRCAVNDTVSLMRIFFGDDCQARLLPAPGSGRPFRKRVPPKNVLGLWPPKLRKSLLVASSQVWDSDTAQRCYWDASKQVRFQRTVLFWVDNPHPSLTLSSHGPLTRPT